MFRGHRGTSPPNSGRLHRDGDFQELRGHTMNTDLDLCGFEPVAERRTGGLRVILPRVLHASAVLVGLPVILPSAAAQAAAFLPASRTVDWTSAGIPGGIPSAGWPVCATLSPSGTADDSVAIQNALNGAPARSVVLLRPGVYNIHRGSKVAYNHADDQPSGVYECGLYINKSVVLRGSGPDKTIIRYGDGANIISIGYTYLSASRVSFVNVTSGATKGSTSLALADASGIAAGSYMVVTQPNPADSDGNPLVDIHGYGGGSASGHDMPTYAMTQIVRVAAVDKDTVTIERPLYLSYTNAPRVYLLPAMLEDAGLENVRLQSTASSGSRIVYKNINLESCGRCWVTNCESDMAVDRSHIYLSDCYGCEIRNNFLDDAYNHNSGLDYAIFLEFRNSENLVENNIVRKARHSLIMNGGSGNVFAYNYTVDAYMGEYHNSLPDTITHAAHPYMNLWEGNVCPNMEFDFTHGSSSHNTLFRNYLNMTSTNPDTGRPMTGALYAITIAYYNNYENVFGNVIGLYGSPNTAEAYQISADEDLAPCIYKLGYFDDGRTPTPNAALSAKVERTLLRGGNWDSLTRTVVWSGNVPGGSLVSSYIAGRELPASLFRSTAPEEFSAPGAVWPPVDPSAATKVNKIPAQLCYEAQDLAAGGTFNPAFYSRAAPVSAH